MVPKVNVCRKAMAKSVTLSLFSNFEFERALLLRSFCAILIIDAFVYVDIESVLGKCRYAMFAVTVRSYRVYR